MGSSDDDIVLGPNNELQFYLNDRGSVNSFIFVDWYCSNLPNTSINAGTVLTYNGLGDLNPDDWSFDINF